MTTVDSRVQAFFAAFQEEAKALVNQKIVSRDDAGAIASAFARIAAGLAMQPKCECAPAGTKRDLLNAVRACALAGKSADLGMSQLLLVCELAERYFDHPPIAAELPRDTERLNWLERMVVRVREPRVHGSAHLFIAKPVSAEGMDDDPSNLRELIDYQQKGGKKP